MHLVYENTKEEIIAIKKHRSTGHRIYIMRWKLYMLQGCVELGVGEELFHMNQGDIGFILSKYHSPLSSIFMSAQSGNLF